MSDVNFWKQQANDHLENYLAERKRREELSAENTRLTARLAEEAAKLAVCDVCCKQRMRDCEEARNVARRFARRQGVVLDIGWPAQYPWLREEPTP